MLADTAKLAVDLSLKDSGFNAGMSKARKATQGLTFDTSKLHSGLSKIGQGIKTGLTRSLIIGAGAVGFLALQLRAGIQSLSDLQKAEAATAAAIKSTGGIAGVTAKAVRDLADKYEDLTTLDDKLIQGGENVLLTFTKVRKKAFEPALKAALDLSVGMGQSLQSSIVQIGKALSDPIKGITALSRVGVTFTEGQKKQIARLVGQNKLFKAQQIILRELNKEFGGRAAAAADTYAGAQARLKDAVEGLQQALAKALLPALTQVATKLSALLKDPAVIQKVQQLGETIAGLFTDANINQGVSGVKNFFGYLSDLPWGVIKDGLKQSAQGAKMVIDLFKTLDPNLQKGLIGLLVANRLGAGAVVSGIGDLLKFALGSLKTIYAGSVTVVGGSVTSGGVPGVGGTGGGKLGTITNTLTAATIVGALAGVGNVVAGAIKDNLPGGADSLLGQGIAAAQNQLLFGQLFGEEAPLVRSQRLLKESIDKNTAKLFGTGAGGGGSWDRQTPQDIRNIAEETAEGARLQRRYAYLQDRIHDSEESGNERRAEKTRVQLQRLLAGIDGTKQAVVTETGVLRKKDFSVNLRTTLNVSAVAIATQIQRVVLGHKVGFL